MIRNNDYIIVGLTGQSGAGKTTVSKYFEKNDFAVINCDLVARNVTNAGSECNKSLAKIFPDCFDKFLTLDRTALAKIVFSNEKKLKLLNDTIFPFIIADINHEINRLISTGKKYILLDAPTLFEAGADSICDVIISCVAERNLRAERISKRDNISAELINKRFDSQKSEDFFRHNSDYIVENNKDESYAIKQCKEIIIDIKRRLNGNG